MGEDIKWDEQTKDEKKLDIYIYIYIFHLDHKTRKIRNMIRYI